MQRAQPKVMIRFQHSPELVSVALQMATASAASFAASSLPSRTKQNHKPKQLLIRKSTSISIAYSNSASWFSNAQSTRLSLSSNGKTIRPQYPLLACLPSSSSAPSTRLYVSGLSFRTTEESLRNAFKIYGELVEVNLVMDKIANRPRGFAFLRYSTEEESRKAIEGMHGKFLDGRVIFVEVAKPRSELRQSLKHKPM